MRLGLRPRITALLLVLSIAPPGAVVWLIRDRVLGLVRAQDYGRIEDALSEFDAAIVRERDDTGQALATVASLLEDSLAGGAHPPARGTATPALALRPGLADTTRRLMEDVGFDCLSILDSAGVVVASGHAPASAGEVQRDRLLLPEKQASFIEETITPGIGRVLTLQGRLRVDLPDGPASLVGGRFLDATFLRRLSPGGTVQAVLLDGDGAILGSSDPRQPLPVPEGWNRSGNGPGTFLVRGVPFAYRTIPLHDRNGETLGTLLAAVSQERLARLSSSLTLIALAVVGTGAIGALVLGLALARGVTRPLRRLEEMSERIAQERYEPLGETAGPAEVRTLADAFNRMARSLAESRERLRQSERLAAAEEVARRVAHEIKNPLSPIALTLEGLVRTRRQRPQEFDRAFEEAVRTIQEEIQRMRIILEDFARFGRLPLPHPRPTDLNGLVRGLLPLFEDNEAGTRIAADLQSDLPPVLLDPDRMSEVINNLLVNALQALGPKGGAVTLATRALPEGAELRVRDSGPGLADEVLRRLFEPYVSTRPGGSGLGLAIARRIVLDHGGGIEAGNHPEGGAEIRIVLPWTPLHEGAGRAAAPVAGGEAWRPS